MNAVPYAFCDSVAAQFTEVRKYQDVLASKIWNAAIRDNVVRRSDIFFSVNLRNGGWAYHLLENGQDGLTIKELQKLDPKYVRFSHIRFSCCPNFEGGIQVSFEEIKDLVKFSLPFINLTDFNLKLENNRPQDNLQSLLLHYRTASFVSIETDSPCADELLAAQLESPLLQGVTVSKSTVSDAAIRELVYKGTFERLNLKVINWNFKQDLMEQLLFEGSFDRRFKSKSIRVQSYLMFSNDNLENLRSELQIETENFALCWLRNDGVMVEVNCSMRDQCHIKFNVLGL